MGSKPRLMASVPPILCKDSANRENYKINYYLFLQLRGRLSPTAYYLLWAYDSLCDDRQQLPNSQRPTFTMLGAVFSELGAVFRNVKVGLFICRDSLFTVSFATFAPQTYHYGHHSKG